jgi:hypothetical protein
VRVLCRVPFGRVRSVWAVTADEGGLEFSAKAAGKETLVEVTLPRLEVATMLVIEP